MKKIYKKVYCDDLVVGQVYYDSANSSKEAMKFIRCITEENGDKTYIFLAGFPKKSKYGFVTKQWASKLGIRYQVGLIPFPDGNMYREIYKNTEDE